MDYIKKAIAKNITELRKEYGFTQIELAEKLNYSDKSISKWERAEAIPDVVVLKEIADLFGVSLDYMIELEHSQTTKSKLYIKRKLHNRAFITGMSIIVVWLLAMLTFIVLDITIGGIKLHWLTFVYSVPLTMVVWLIFNSIWFNKRRNFIIISLLMWSGLLAIFTSFLFFEINIWKIILLGIPGQIIIFMWSRLKSKQSNANEEKTVK